MRVPRCKAIARIHFHIYTASGLIPAVIIHQVALLELLTNLAPKVGFEPTMPFPADD